MAKNKYYAVKNGKEIGIFDNWADCSKQVHGFPGAIYKGFPTLAEAEKYFNGQESKESKYYETEDELMKDIKDGEMIAYVDGSNLGDGSAFSWGIVTFSKSLGKKCINGMSTNEEQAKYRNITADYIIGTSKPEEDIIIYMKREKNMSDEDINEVQMILSMMDEATTLYNMKNCQGY